MVSNTNGNDRDNNMPRVRRSISFDEALLSWIDEKVEEDYRYKDRSHLIEVALRELKEKIEQK